MTYERLDVEKVEAIDPAEDRRCSRCKQVDDIVGVVDIYVEKTEGDYVSLCAPCLLDCLNLLKDAM